MIYGYTRISTPAQDITVRRAQLDATGCEKSCCERISSVHAERSQLRKLTALLQPGVVVSTSAVGHTSHDANGLLVIARQMMQAGAGLRSSAEPFLDTTLDFVESVLAIFGIAAKLERRRRVERTAHGRTTAKAQGMKLGRKPKLTLHQQREAAARVMAGKSQRAVARSYDVSQSTIARLPHTEAAYG